jgi:hypothetical protein
MEDLFEKDFSELPIEVQEVLSKYAYDEFNYENCGNLVDDLNSIGYTCEYGLSAEPFDLRRLTIYDNWTDMEIDEVFNTILKDIQIYSWLDNKDVEELREKIIDRHTKIMYLIFCEEKFNKTIAD